MDEKRKILIENIGTGNILDPLKPRKLNTIKARVGNVASYFQKYIKDYPGGFSVSRDFLCGFLGVEDITPYVRGLFKKYGFHLKAKKSVVFIEVI